MRRGVTTVIVSHNLDHLVSQCDRLIWLDEGKVVADGAAAEVARAYRSCSGRSAGARTVP
jgi:ABC-type polysaccharide/polyol phosphate transport system ATPase subunit